jgi:hypothetical protein
MSFIDNDDSKHLECDMMKVNNVENNLFYEGSFG